MVFILLNSITFTFNIKVVTSYRCVMRQPIGLTKHTTEPGEAWEGLNSNASWEWMGN